MICKFFTIEKTNHGMEKTSWTITRTGCR